MAIGCERCDGSAAGGAAPGASYHPVGSLAVGPHPVEFYVAYGPDTAILGFMRAAAAGAPQYCPMYGSTYRGLPAVELEIFASNDQQQMWVASSWQGYEQLAHHRFGTDSCSTQYGDAKLIATPIPKVMSGGTTIPKMDAAKVAKVGTVEYAER